MDGRLESHDSRFDRLDKTVQEEAAETREYVDLRVGELRTEMNVGFANVNEQLGRQRQLIGTEFAKATVHADNLYERLNAQFKLQVEHQTSLFERQDRLDQRVTRLERE